MPGLPCATVRAMPCISICAPYIQAESSCDASRLHAAHVFMRIAQPRYNYPPEIADSEPSGMFFPHTQTRRHNNIWTAALLPQNNRLALLTPRFCRHCFATGQFHTHLARQPPILQRRCALHIAKCMPSGTANSALSKSTLAIQWYLTLTT